VTRAFFKVLRWLPCLLFALAATSAFAHCRPENRVWGFSEKPSNFASQETAKPIDTPGENPDCGYDFASGVHNYLYCQGSPVDNDDPSGLASTVAAQNGVAVHQYIGDDFTEKVPGGVSGPSVVNVLEGIPGFKLPPKFQGVVTALFPDLTATIQQEVYEIKPDNARSIALGEAQLQAYIDLFNLLDPRKGWHRGTSYRPPLTVPINALNYAIAVGSPATPPGLILYHVFSVQKIVQKKVVQAAVADNADLADSIGISTLTTIIAF